MKHIHPAKVDVESQLDVLLAVDDGPMSAAQLSAKLGWGSHQLVPVLESLLKSKHLFTTFANNAWLFSLNLAHPDYADDVQPLPMLRSPQPETAARAMCAVRCSALGICQAFEDCSAGS